MSSVAKHARCCNRVFTAWFGIRVSRPAGRLMRFMEPFGNKSATNPMTVKNLPTNH